MADLTPKQRADKMRQIADLMQEVDLKAVGRGMIRDIADELDPPDPLAGLTGDQWVEVDYHPNGAGYGEIVRVRSARSAIVPPRLIRVVPDGDVREVLVIPVGEARERSQDSGRCVCGPARLIDRALDKHDERWSS